MVNIRESFLVILTLIMIDLILLKQKASDTRSERDLTDKYIAKIDQREHF